MYMVHGTYPMQDWHCNWRIICELTDDSAYELINEAINECGPLNEYDRLGDDNHLIINKGFRIVFSRFGAVFAVYARDWSYLLIAAEGGRFMEEMKRKDLSLDKTPGFPTHPEPPF